MTKPSALADLLNAPKDQPYAPPAVEPKPAAKVLPIPSWCQVSPKIAAGEHPVAISDDTVLLRYAPGMLPGAAPNLQNGETTPLPTGCQFVAPPGQAVEVCAVQTHNLVSDVDQFFAEGYRALPGYSVSYAYKAVRGEVLYTLGVPFSGMHKSVVLGRWVQSTQRPIEPGTIIGFARLVAAPLDDCRRV